MKRVIRREKREWEKQQIEAMEKFYKKTPKCFLGKLMK